MAKVPLYPWYVKSNIYSLKGFDKNWFEQTVDGLVPKCASQEIFCLTTLHSWDFFCELPHPIHSETITLQIDNDHPPRKSERAVAQFQTRAYGEEGYWQGNTYFEIFARSSLAEAFVTREESYWGALPNVELHKIVDESCIVSKSVMSASAISHLGSLKHEVAYSLFKTGGHVPHEWDLDESLFSREDDAIPIMDIWES